MERVDVIKLLGSTFKKENIPCVLVGGFAVNAHHYSRQTEDVDFLMLHHDQDKIAAVLTKVGYEMFETREAYARFADKDRKMMTVDLLFTDENTLKEIIAAGSSATLSGETFVVPSINHLIAMKLHAIKQNPGGREFKDLLDIAALVKENKLDVTAEWFRSWCLKYGTEDTYRKLRLFFESRE